jgi:hypothetical protein
LAKTPLAEAGCAHHASDLGSRSRQFPKISRNILRQNGTTGNLRMTRVRELPVGQSATCSVCRALHLPHGEMSDDGEIAFTP